MWRVCEYLLIFYNCFVQFGLLNVLLYFDILLYFKDSKNFLGLFFRIIKLVCFMVSDDGCCMFQGIDIIEFLIICIVFVEKFSIICYR